MTNVPLLSSLLKQVCDSRMKIDDIYHHVPVPWLQIKLLQVLERLGHDNKAASQEMYQVIRTCMKKCEHNNLIGYGKKCLIVLMM